LAARITGDVNQDGQVSLIDLSRLLASFGRTTDAWPSHGDIDRDRDVDLADLTLLLGSVGQICP
jgi:hypothetical protein